MSNDGIIISDSEPTSLDKVTWLKILPDGSREWYERTGESWALVKTESAPALANHTHADLTGEFEGTFKKIKIENGIVTDFELE